MSEEAAYEGMMRANELGRHRIAVDEFMGHPFTDWTKIKRIMDMHNYRSIDELVNLIDRLEDTEKKYVTVVTCLKEINKVIP